LPYPAVNAFAQQAGVPAMPGVFLDPVHPQLPDGVALPARQGARVRIPGQYRIGCRLLAGKVSECALDQGLLHNRRDKPAGPS
jgi:hypothetical protein